jgi:glutaredoxin
MAEKVELKESESPPSCPHCKTALRKVHWHKVQGGPGMVNYIVLVSCPHCRMLLGTLGA